MDHPGQDRRFSEFGPFGFDHKARLLYRGGTLVPLAPKALDLLSVLIEKHGQVVNKEELVQSVWPGAFVEESNLAHHVSVLRKALMEGAPGQRYIETISKRGYRFVGVLNERRENRSNIALHTAGTQPAAGA